MATFSFVSLAGKLRFLTNLFILIFHFIYSFHMVPDYIKSGRFLRLCELVSFQQRGGNSYFGSWFQNFSPWLVGSDALRKELTHLYKAKSRERKKYPQSRKIPLLGCFPKESTSFPWALHPNYAIILPQCLWLVTKPAAHRP